MVNLYVWDSSTFSRYSNGTIMVLAESIESAREIAYLKGKKQILEGNWFYYDDSFSEKDLSDYDITLFNDYDNRLKEDLANDPKILKVGEGYIIYGSE